MAIGQITRRWLIAGAWVLTLPATSISAYAGNLLSHSELPFLALGAGLFALLLPGFLLWKYDRSQKRLQSLQNVLDAAPSGLLCIDSNGLIQFANPTACSIFDYDNDALIGRSVEVLIPPQFRERHPGLRASFLQEGRSRRMGEGRDIRGVTRDGREIPLEIGLTHLGSGDNSMVIVGVIDIRELKEAKTIIERQNQHLGRSVKELQQFAFSASHDLREPLRKVMNYIEILQEDYETEIDDDGKAVLNSMAGSVQRMESLLDSLLNYSRITTRAQPLEPVSLKSVLADVVDDLSLLISEKQATVEYKNLPVVMGDRNQLRQLFQNFISNSLKYQRNDVAPVVEVEGNKESPPNGHKGFVAIQVRDNGIGFDNQYKDIIFDVFKRLHGRDRFSGIGMGLAICRKIVERHEGFIAADGVVNKGATFKVWLKADG